MYEKNIKVGNQIYNIISSICNYIRKLSSVNNIKVEKQKLYIIYFLL